MAASAPKRLARFKAAMPPENELLRVDVLASGNLADEPDLAHPLVRLHLVDARTGTYLPKTSARATTTFEHSRVVNLTRTTTNPKGAPTLPDESRSMESVLPVATKPAHLSDKCVAPVCNDTFLFDVPFLDVLKPEVLMLFEVADFRHIQSTHRPESGRRRSLPAATTAPASTASPGPSSAPSDTRGSL
mmetsp:Transcript_16605/g.54079  ORF Transcript_16605/g.54079 Transcript_16605/m.54079 type:complete len:189 (-) Transcript_16605:96-662(-)